jgi:hypothetical protein
MSTNTVKLEAVLSTVLQQDLSTITAAMRPGSNEPSLEWSAIQAHSDSAANKHDAGLGLIAQYNAFIVLSLLKSGMVKRSNGTSFNSGTGPDQYKGAAANLFKRLVKDKSIAAIPASDKNNSLAACINRCLRPMIFNGVNLEEGVKLVGDQGFERRRVVSDVTSRRQNHRQSIELGMLLYALGYEPSDFVDGTGWSIWELDLVPLKLNGKLFKWQPYNPTNPTRITLHPRKNGYHFVSVKGENGAPLSFRANYGQLMDAWKSDGSPSNQNAAAVELTLADARNIVQAAIKKPITAEQYDVMARLYNLLAIQMEKHAELADKIKADRARLDQIANDKAKAEAIELERANAAKLASSDEVIAAGKAKLAAKTAAAEAKAESERDESVKDRKGGAAA